MYIKNTRMLHIQYHDISHNHRYPQIKHTSQNLKINNISKYHEFSNSNPKILEPLVTTLNF